MGAVLGMSQAWFMGPSGGDVGFELAFAFSATSYCVMRYFEKKYFGW